MDSACEDPAAVPTIHCAKTVTAHFDDSGRLWLAWSIGAHVYLNHSDNGGKTLSPTIAVNRTPEPVSAQGENRPKVVTDPSGNIYVSWTTPLQKRFTGHIRFSSSSDGGLNFSAPVTVNDDLSETGHRFEALGVNRRGDVYLAWLDKRDRERLREQGKEYNGAALYYTTSVDHGKTFAVNSKAMDNSCECCRVALAFDNDRLPVVMWRHIYGDNIRDHALVKFIDRTTAGTPVRVSHDQWHVEACPHHGPGLSIADDGIYHAVWFNDGAERRGIFYAHSTDQGKHFSTPLSVGSYDRGASHAHVLSLGRLVYIVWLEFNGNEAELLMMQSVDGGRQWSEAVTLATAPGNSDRPFLLYHRNRVYISWQQPGRTYSLIPVASSGQLGATKKGG